MRSSYQRTQVAFFRPSNWGAWQYQSRGQCLITKRGYVKISQFDHEGASLNGDFSDTIQGLENDCEVTSSFSFDDGDPPRPETFLRAQNHDPFGRKSSFSPRCADNGQCHADANPVAEVPETPRSTIKSSGGASVSGKDDDGLLSCCMLYEGEEALLGVPLSEVQPSFEYVAETSPPQLDHQVAQDITSGSLYTKVDSVRSYPTNRKRPAIATLETDGEASGPRTRARVRAKVPPSFGHAVENLSQATQHVTRSSMCIKTESARSKPTNRKRPAGAALETGEKAGGPRTRARARAEASEASSSLPTSYSARPYSAAVDRSYK
jgi:hypothetical protein